MPILKQPNRRKFLSTDCLFSNWGRKKKGKNLRVIQLLLSSLFISYPQSNLSENLLALSLKYVQNPSMLPTSTFLQYQCFILMLSLIALCMFFFDPENCSSHNSKSGLPKTKLRIGPFSSQNCLKGQCQGTYSSLSGPRRFPSNLFTLPPPTHMHTHTFLYPKLGLLAFPQEKRNTFFLQGYSLTAFSPGIFFPR